MPGPKWSGVRAALACASFVGCALACGRAEIETRQIRVSVVPGASEQALRERYASLVTYLGETTGYEVLLSVPTDYQQLLDDFDADRVDLAWFGGLTFAQAHARSGAEPLVTRDTDVAFTSEFIAIGSGSAGPLEEWRGRRFAFGPPLSTSGHLMPRSFLEGRGIVPEEFFSTVRHSRGHDETVWWVREGVVDLAAVNSAALRSMIADGKLAPDALRTIEVTTPFQNYVWSTRAGLPQATRLALRDAFLALDPSEPEHAAILRDMNAGGYLPIEASRYERLESVAAALGLLGETP